MRNQLILRDVRQEDLPVFFEHQRDPEALRVAAVASRDQDAFFAHWRGRVLANSQGEKRTIVVDGQVAGYLLSWIDGPKRLVGYWVGRELWGRGIATEALRQFLACELTRPLFAYVAVHNRGSIRVLEKCGFQKQGEATPDAGGVEELLYVLNA